MKVILADGNAVGYSSQQTRALTTNAGEPTQAIFHSIKSVWGLKSRYKEHTPLFLWDSHTQWRYDILPEYKGKREEYKQQVEMREQYREQRPHIQEALKLMGVVQIQHEGYEADDIAGVYARKINSMNDSEAVLYTGDKDWLQLVGENVTFHEIGSDKRVGLKNFQRVTGFSNPIEFLQAKALHGDSSDNISGVGGIGEKTADLLMQRYGSVKSLLLDHKKHGNFEKGYFENSSLDRARNKINAFCNNDSGGIDLYKRNLALMNLHRIVPPKSGFFRQRSKPDLEGFKDFCMRWEMISLVEKAERIFTDMGYLK